MADSRFQNTEFRRQRAEVRSKKQEARREKTEAGQYAVGRRWWMEAI
jgi:hypothetical protein